MSETDIEPDTDPYTDKTALSYWFPLIQDAGVRVPKTVILKMPRGAQEAIISWMGDGEEADKDSEMELRIFVDQLRVAAKSISEIPPWFLRTDHTSGKHNWDKTCYVRDLKLIGSNISALVEFSEMADLVGLPWDTWVVREYLPVITLGRCPRYGNMPVVREFRYFVDDGVVRCVHPYWPDGALLQGSFEGDKSASANLVVPPTYKEPRELASKAGAAVGGSWSVDVISTKRGWFVTDMAEAHKSWHWEGCPHEFHYKQKEVPI